MVNAHGADKLIAFSLAALCNVLPGVVALPAVDLSNITPEKEFNLENEFKAALSAKTARDTLFAPSLLGEETVETGVITALQWNPHWKTSSSVGDKVTQDLQWILTEYNIDFANMIEYTDRDASTVMGISPDLGKHAMIDSRRDGQDVCSQDKTTLLYDSTRWTPTGEAGMGCTENNDNRPYIVQTFTSISSGEKICVVGAHWPHFSVAGVMKTAINALGCTGSNVLFMADTNLPQSYAISQISEKMGLGTVGEDALGSDENFMSCCSDDGYTNNFDRIIANFGSKGETFYPLGNAGMSSMPDYVTDAAWEFHLPLVFKITL